MTNRQLAVLAAGCAVALLAAWSFAPAPRPVVGPVAEFPTQIDLGDRRPNEAVRAILPLVNRGDRPLVVDQISTSCSCAGLEVEQDGKPARLTGLTLPPGERIELTFRMAVAAPPGQGQQVSIRFHTNDPRTPAAHVIATVPRVVGRPSAVPAEVAFGAVPLGRPAAERVRVRANAVAGLRVVRVISSRPDRLTVAAESAADPEAVAEVRVGLSTTEPGEVAAEATVEMVAADGTAHTVRVPVSGRVRRPVEAAPSHLLLPDGRDQAVAFLLGASEAPFTAKVDAVPAGLTATLELEPPLAGRSQMKLVVKRSGAAAGTRPVRLTVVPSAAPPYTLEVPVSCPTGS